MQILASFIFWVYTGFYSLTFQSIDGNNISMAQFQGKKVLLVNIATGSSRVSQLQQLQQLQEQYADSVVVIGFPSSSFGLETRSNAEIKQFCQTQYGATFTLASKMPVAGVEKQPVYQWLTTLSQNGVINQEVNGDFQKYLINSSGSIIGVYSGVVSPLDSAIVNSILQ